MKLIISFVYIFVSYCINIILVALFHRLLNIYAYEQFVLYFSVVHLRFRFALWQVLD